MMRHDSGGSVKLAVELGLAALLTLAGGAPVLAAGADSPVAAAIEDLAWLAGEWRTDDARGLSVDTQYGRPGGGVILGHSRMLAGNNLEFYEFETFSVVEGRLTLTPSPFGQPGVSFEATINSPGHVRFENPRHDFPSVIEYTLLPDGRLLSVAAGTQDGQPIRYESTQSRPDLSAP